MGASVPASARINQATATQMPCPMSVTTARTIPKPTQPDGDASQKPTEWRFAKVTERPRQFVRTREFFGPDRRRTTDGEYKGDRRRNSDRKPDEAK